MWETEAPGETGRNAAQTSSAPPEPPGAPQHARDEQPVEVIADRRVRWRWIGHVLTAAGGRRGSGLSGFRVVRGSLLLPLGRPVELLKLVAQRPGLPPEPLGLCPPAEPGRSVSSAGLSTSASGPAGRAR